jgi:hypothetical protein
MRRFFDKRATVVNVTDKVVIDVFQVELYNRRTFKDFGRRLPSSITKLKDMITSWADEVDKANAKYDSNRARARATRAATTTSRIMGVATIITTRVLTASISQTTQSRLYNTL